MTTAPPTGPHTRWFPVLLLSGLACACLRLPQRLPGPLLLPDQPEAPAPVEPPPFAAVVQRDSDPVWVRRPGERGEYLLPFYGKRERLTVGAGVRTGAGGRAELLWSPDASTLVLFDEGRITLGDPEQDEPLVAMHSVTHALLVLTPEDRIALPGGALLRGDAVDTTGPVLLERQRAEILRVTNQSKRTLLVHYRDLALELGPGESLDLPELSGGSAPLPAGPESALMRAGDLVLSHTGRLERSEEATGLLLRAEEPVHIEALGIALELAPREEVRLANLTPAPRP